MARLALADDVIGAGKGKYKAGRSRCLRQNEGEELQIFIRNLWLSINHLLATPFGKQATNPVVCLGSLLIP